MLAKAQSPTACAVGIAVCICVLSTTVSAWQDIPRASRAGGDTPGPLGERSWGATPNSTVASTWAMPPAVTRVYAPVSAPPAQLQHWQRDTAPYLVCTSPEHPIVRCNELDYPSTYTGYQVELFRLLAKDLGWSPEDYTMKCMPYDDLIADLVSVHGNCTVAAAGVIATPEQLAKGLRTSWPTYKSGLSVLVTGKMQTGSTWAFSQAFHWTVWLALGASTVAVGVGTLFLESQYCGWANVKRQGMDNWMYYSFTVLMKMWNHVGDPKAPASKVLVLTWGFLILILMHLYTAVSATIIHKRTPQLNISGLDQLQNARVLTAHKYVPIVQKDLNVTADGHSWNGDSDLNVMLDLLSSGAYDALILETPVLQYVVGTDDTCTLFLVGDPFRYFSIGLGFPVGTNDTVISAWSTAMVRQQTHQGALDNLENVYIKKGGAQCVRQKTPSKGGQVYLHQVAGLWYILLCATGWMWAVLVFHYVRKKAFPAKQLLAVLTNRTSITPAPPPDAPQAQTAAAVGAVATFAPTSGPGLVAPGTEPVQAAPAPHQGPVPAKQAPAPEGLQAAGTILVPESPGARASPDLTVTEGPAAAPLSPTLRGQLQGRLPPLVQHTASTTQ